MSVEKNEEKKSVLILIMMQLFLTVHILRRWMWEVLRAAGGEGTATCLEMLWVSSLDVAAVMRK